MFWTWFNFNRWHIGPPKSPARQAEMLYMWAQARSRMSLKKSMRIAHLTADLFWFEQE